MSKASNLVEKIDNDQTKYDEYLELLVRRDQLFKEKENMGKMASKKSVEQLERLFDFLGKYGGTIETVMK